MSYVVKRPLLTEKNNLLASQNTYVFEVNRSADKTAIKEHIEKYFNVKVMSVNTSVCRGRARRTQKGYGRVKYWKKAVVRLVQGEKITLFAGN